MGEELQQMKKKFLLLSGVLSGLLLFVLIIMVRPQKAMAYEISGMDASSVFDAGFYYDKYEDLQEAFGYDPDALFDHFINYGIYEGRQGNDEFDVDSYRNRYPDLEEAFGDDNREYLDHYLAYGMNEGRVAYQTDFTLVFDADYYLLRYSDIVDTYGYDRHAALWHFVHFGIQEGRQACDSFDAMAYKYSNDDLRYAYGDDEAAYVFHYIYYGQYENRRVLNQDSYFIANKDLGYMFSIVFDYKYYLNHNDDVLDVTGWSESKAFSHYLNYGIKEGRSGNGIFDQNYYRDANPDLQAKYGDDIRSYVFHYVEYGYYEGRPANGDDTPVPDHKPVQPASLTAGSKGIDVSSHQGSIDWDAVKDSGEVQFAIIRVGYGSDESYQDDARAMYNMDECERLGIPYGVYLYSYAVTEVEAHSEVDHILRMLEGRNPLMGVYIDIEDTDYYMNRAGEECFDPYSDEGRERLTRYTRIILNGISDAGYTAGVYANVNYYENILYKDDLSGYRWIAGYGNYYDYCVENDALMWQYTSSGEIPGITANTVDLDVLIKDITF